MILAINKSDTIGILSSTLCIVHCIATPFLFAFQANALKCYEFKPLWWSSLDIIFLIVSALAIYKSCMSISNKWIVIALSISWLLLVLIIINEKLAWFDIQETTVYLPSLSLIFFHWYGSKFCQCKNERCCINEL